MIREPSGFSDVIILGLDFEMGRLKTGGALANSRSGTKCPGVSSWGLAMMRMNDWTQVKWLAILFPGNFAIGIRFFVR